MTPAHDTFEYLPSLARVVRDSVSSLGFSLVYFGVSLFASIIFARILVPAEYGDYQIAMATMSLAGLAVTFGAQRVATRFIPGYATADDLAHISGLIRFFVGLILTASLIVGTIIVVGEYVVRNQSLEARFHPIAVAAIAIPVYALAISGADVLRSFGALAVAVAPTRVVAPLLALLSVVILVNLGVSITDWMIVLCAAWSFVGAIGLQTLVLVRLGQLRTLAAHPSFEARTWLALGVPVMLTGLTAELIKSMDILMIELLGETEEMVGAFGAATSVVWITMIVRAASTIVFAPYVGAATERQDHQRLQVLLSQQIGYIGLVSGLITICVIVFSYDILLLFGDEYLDAQIPLIILACGYFIASVFGTTRLFLQNLGHGAVSLRLLVFAGAANMLLNLVLIPLFGMVGAAISTVVAFSAMAVGEAVLLVRKEGLVPLPWTASQKTTNP